MHLFHKWYYPLNGYRICLKCEETESFEDSAVFGSMWCYCEPDKWIKIVKSGIEYKEEIKQKNLDAIQEIRQFLNCNIKGELKK